MTMSSIFLYLRLFIFCFFLAYLLTLSLFFHLSFLFVFFVLFFFFKQKTAYEMRISDWSSDVCSSDLYAGLFVIPFVLLLAVTGAAYLFKPQVERWEERAFQNLPTERAIGPQAQLDAALAAFPDARFDSYRLPERSGDAAMIRVAIADGDGVRDVFVSPQGEVLGSLAPESRHMELDKRIHGQLLLGKRGSWLVELAASWAIVLMLSGLDRKSTRLNSSH